MAKKGLTDDLKQQQALKVLGQAWIPHSGQVKAGKALFGSNADLIYVECGRKFGKSEFAVYCCWMYALTRPNAEIYYLAPAVKQARELVWSNQRMQTCNTYQNDFMKLIEKIYGAPIKVQNNEMRITLPNGSFIKVDGSDNYNTQRGLKPDFVVADEYRDFKKQWIEAVRPNMSVKKGKILFITTPPHSPNHAYHLAEECKNGDDHYYYLNLPSMCNDRIPGHDTWLEREKVRLVNSGRRNEWRREYMAEFITSNEHAVIPQLNRDLLQPYDDLIHQLSHSIPDVQLYVTVDPGNSSTFAAVVSAYDPYNSTLYLLDCIYEEDATNTSAREAWPKVQKAYDDVKSDIRTVVNEEGVYVSPRTPWFTRDLHDLFQIPAIPVGDQLKDALYNVSLIKDIAAAGKLKVSDRMKELITESELYQRSHNTLKIDNDQRQLINCLRYVLYATSYTVEKLQIPEKAPKDEDLLERITSTPKFDEWVREIRAQEYGILCDDEFIDFADDNDM